MLFNDTHKLEKQKWVSGHNGCSLELVLCCVFTLVAIPALLRRQIIWRFSVYKLPLGKTLLEIGCIAVPAMLATTEYCLPLSVVVCLVSFVIWLGKRADADAFGRQTHLNRLNKPRRPYIEHRRSIITIGTCFSILAVDFVVFPRKYAKTENRGVSIMDMGVGLYVYGSAMVSQIARGKQPQTMVKALQGSAKGSIPLLVFGIVRFFMVKLSNYQEHVTEYGVHWNFFFTLAVLIVIASAIAVYIPPGGTLYCGMAGVVVAVLYQCALSNLGLEHFIENDNRSNIIAQNKEGIFSLFGYLGLYLIGSAIGSVVLQGDKKYRQWWQTAIGLSIATGALMLSRPVLQQLFGQPSRKMMNFPFVVDCLIVNLFVDAVSLSIDLFFPCKSNNTCVQVLGQSTDTLIVSNQLVVFLVANLVTGAVNASINTLVASSVTSYVILGVYTLFLLGFPLILLQNKNTKRKQH